MQARRPVLRCQSFLSQHCRHRPRNFVLRHIAPENAPSGRPLSSTSERHALNETNVAPRSSRADPDIIITPPSNFSKPTLSALHFWLRFVKFSAVGVAAFAVLGFTALQATHLYVEHVGLTPDADPDGGLARWGWDRDAERWSGTDAGTDSGLGWKARTAVRAAWTALHWGAGANAVRSTQAHAPQSTTGAVDASLGFAHDFLNVAIAAAHEHPEDLNPGTLPALLALHARTLERIGSRGALFDARLDYEQVWAAQLSAAHADAHDKARIALRLGDVCARVGDGESARTWWARALALAWGEDGSRLHENDTDVGVHLPARLPASPRAQRIISGTLASLSVHHAQACRASEAVLVQQQGVALLTPEAAIPDVLYDSTRTGSPEALHRLFLRHRAMLLSLHQVEVSAASQPLTNDAAAAARECMAIGIEMEAAARLLSGADVAVPSPGTAPPTEPAAAFAKARALDNPARTLMRDIRRTAAGGWLLAGVLFENAVVELSKMEPDTEKRTSLGLFSSGSKPNSGKGKMRSEDEREVLQRLALECFTRALAWTGEDAPEAERARLVSRVAGAQASLTGGSSEGI